jgi:HEAT repeat protein
MFAHSGVQARRFAGLRSLATGAKLARLMTRLCLAACALLALGCSRLPAEARDARRLLQQGAYQDAESVADKGLTRHPGQPALWRAKIQAAMSMGEAERAVSIYQTWARTRGGHDHRALEHMALTTLWQGLRVPSTLVRTRAIRAVERLEVQKLARDVADRISDDDDTVAAAAAIALLRSQPGAAQVATQLLRSDDPRARAIVVQGIGRKIRSGARKDLLPALADREPVVRRAALGAIAPMNNPADTARFIAMAESDADGDVRASAIAALATGNRAGAVPVARRALGDQHRQARIAAVEFFASKGDQPVLQQVVSTAEPIVALRAAALLRARDQSSKALVERALADPGWQVRAAALDALADTTPREQAVVLAGARLGDDDARVRVAAARTLARLDDPRGAEALAALCSAPDAAIREAAVRGHARGRLLTTGLIAALADESAPVRVLAAEIVLDIVD